MASMKAEMNLGEFASWAAARGTDLRQLDFTPALKSVRQAIISDVKENFAGGHSPDGTPWPPLAHARPNSKGSDQPLRDKGLLMASITSAGSNGHIESLTSSTLIFGTNLEYAALHQYGGTITPKNAKALTIPLTREAARSGGARRFPRPLFILKSDNGKAFLAEEVAKGKKGKTKLTLHYLLSQGVRIPARPFLGIGQKLADRISVIFSDYLRKKLGMG
jgi:phage gpG-like protein